MTCKDSIPQAIVEAIIATGLKVEKAALESGGISHWLVSELMNLGLPVVWIDTCKMSAAISMRTNKTCKNIFNRLNPKSTIDIATSSRDFVITSQMLYF
ncbi:MAG: hypothetical protein LLF94_01260 [Chlamydiales bacterium]|nr:hypothetical protein [Chlamydiales bacterium]